MIADLVAKNRSYRKFDEKTSIPREDLEALVDLARQCPSGGNLQPLKYFLSNDPETNARIFSCLSWAGYLEDWSGPEEGERPAAYVVILRDNQITTNFVIDHGIAVQTMKLAAIEKGLGGCIIGTIDRARLRETFDIPVRYEILIALALGKPTESIVIDPAEGDNIKYWRDKKNVHHVPKRPLKELIITF